MSMGLHNKYRPVTLAKIIGNEQAVSTLSGMIKSNSYPSAILFTGPPGVGKTTIARAFVFDILGDKAQENLTEVNFGSERSIEEVRQLVQLSRLRPSPGASRRFILGDEVHQLVSNKTAADAFLKPLEEPVKTTTFLLCSMEPEKFSGSKTGQAIASRCVNILLKKPTDEEIRKQIRRILKGEKMLESVDSEAIDLLVQNSESSMRIAANLVESLRGVWLNTEKGKLTADKVSSVVSSTLDNDDALAGRFLFALYSRKFVAAHKELLDVADGYAFMGKCLNMNWFILNQILLKGARHPKVWGNTPAWNTWKSLAPVIQEMQREVAISVASEINNGLVQLKLGSGSFAVDERQAMSALAWGIISKVSKL